MRSVSEKEPESDASSVSTPIDYLSLLASSSRAGLHSTTVSTFPSSATSLPPPAVEASLQREAREAFEINEFVKAVRAEVDFAGQDYSFLEQALHREFPNGLAEYQSNTTSGGEDTLSEFTTRFIPSLRRCEGHEGELLAREKTNILRFLKKIAKSAIKYDTSEGPDVASFFSSALSMTSVTTQIATLGLVNPGKEEEVNSGGDYPPFPPTWRDVTSVTCGTIMALASSCTMKSKSRYDEEDLGAWGWIYQHFKFDESLLLYYLFLVMN